MVNLFKDIILLVKLTLIQKFLLIKRLVNLILANALQIGIIKKLRAPYRPPKASKRFKREKTRLGLTNRVSADKRFYT